MKKIAQGIVRFRKLILTVAFLLLIPSAIGAVATRINYDILFLKNMPSSIKDSIIINCATKIILDHSEHRQNLPEVKAVLSITDEEAYMIESLQRTERWREFFIKMSNDAFIFRNEVSDFAAVAFDSRQATVVRLKQLFNESGSTYTAINRYLEERRKKYG